MAAINLAFRENNNGGNMNGVGLPQRNYSVCETHINQMLGLPTLSVFRFTCKMMTPRGFWIDSFSDLLAFRQVSVMCTKCAVQLLHVAKSIGVTEEA